MYKCRNIPCSIAPSMLLGYHSATSSLCFTAHSNTWYYHCPSSGLDYVNSGQVTQPFAVQHGIQVAGSADKVVVLSNLACDLLHIVNLNSLPTTPRCH